MKKKYIDLLRALGMQDSEARVYFAALKLGPSSVQSIAKEAGVSRTAAYTAIELLEERGVFTSATRGKKQLYIAEKPERLLSHIKSELRHMQEKVEVMEQSIDDISLAAGGDRPTVRFFEGKDAFAALAEDIDKKNPSAIWEIVNVKDMEAFYADPDHAAVRKQLHKILISRKRDLRVLNSGAPDEVRKHRVLREVPGKYKFHGSVLVYKDTVGMLTVKDKMVFALIDNEHIADTIRTLFDMAWEGRGE